MKERPILFSGPMVRAIIAGRKTQTRRPLRVQPLDILPMNTPGQWVTLRTKDPEPHGDVIRCRFGEVGDRLWVRETFALAPHGYIYRADYNDGKADEVVDLRTGETVPLAWKPSIFMPRVACRIVLEIVNVRAERVKRIGRLDAQAEGVLCRHCKGYSDNNVGCRCTDLYSELWDSINYKRGFGWDANPFVWVVEFKRL